MPSTVDSIRQLLDKRDGLSQEAMQPLAAAYSEEVARVNERLREAVQLLRKGLRSEAIQRASLHPNAIETAAGLDFPENEEWFEILQFLGISVPPELDRDAAEQLNEAIVETQPLAALLKQHRRLAIARAPLAWRLKILRRIASLDPASSIWEEDLENWENARLKKVPVELEAAIKAEDSDKVALILDELTTQSWRNKPDAKLIKQARTASNRFTHDALIGQLRPLAPQLHDAFSEFNETEARRLREQWRQIQQQMTVPLPVELGEQAESALLWLEEIDRQADLDRERGIAIGQLELALDAQAPLADLQRAFHQTTRFDDPLSLELQQRYRVAVEERQLATKRKTQAVFAGIIAATLVVAGAFGYWQFQSYQRQKIATARDQLKSLLDEQKLDEAVGLWSRIESNQPNLAADTQLAKLASQMTEMLADESSRAAQFARYLEQADNPDPAAIDLSSLARAEKMAVNEVEKAAAFQLRRRRSNWDSEIAAKHSEEVAAALVEVRQQLDQYESMAVTDLDSNDFAPLINRLRSLETEFPRRSPSASGQIELVRSRAAAMQQAVGEHRRQMEIESRAFDHLTDATSLQGFAQGLEAFARDAPDSPVADEFAQAATEKQLWYRALAWNDVADSLMSALTAGVTPDKAKDLLERHAKLTQDLERNPAESIAPEWVSRLETVNNRSKILDQVFGDLPQTVVAELITVVDSSGTRYFAYKTYRDRFPDRFDPKSRAETSIDVVGTESGAVTGRAVKAPLTAIPEPQATILWLSGLGRSGRQAFLQGWEVKFLKTMAELRNREQLDGTVKEMLLFHLLEGACEGSPSLRANLSSQLEMLRSRGEARRQWFAPAPLNNELDHEIETTIIKRLADVYRSNPNSFADLHSVAACKYRWIGFLTRDSSGSVASHMNESPARPGTLFIVRASLANPDQVTWVPVGEWKADQVKLNRASGDLAAGRPLFFLSTPTTSGS